MSAQHRTEAPRTRPVRADVRQALLKPGCGQLYPGIPPGEWQPAVVMADQVRALRPDLWRGPSPALDRVLDERHFEFRGRLSAGALDDQRRSRLEDRRDRQEGLE